MRPEQVKGDPCKRLSAVFNSKMKKFTKSPSEGLPGTAVVPEPVPEIRSPLLHGTGPRATIGFVLFCGGLDLASLTRYGAQPGS